MPARLLPLLLAAALLPAADELRSAGCKTEFFLIKALGAAHQQASGAGVNPGSTGNRKAIELLAEGKLDFAFTCKPGAALAQKFNVPKEIAATWRTTAIAKDPVVLVAHPACGATALSLDQVKAVFAGKLANWKEAGGADLPLLQGRLDATVESGVVTVLKELTVGEEGSLAAAKELKSPEALGNWARSTPGALVSMGLNSYQPEYGTLLAIDGKAPSREEVLAGRYPLAVTYHLVVPEGKAARCQPFLDLVASAAGRAVIDRMMVATGR